MILSRLLLSFKVLEKIENILYIFETLRCKSSVDSDIEIDTALCSSKAVAIEVVRAFVFSA
jgi:hypothetical protein